MLTRSNQPRTPFPKGWQGCLKTAVLYAISLAHYAIVFARAWATDNINARVKNLYLLGHVSVKTTEKAYAACVKNERFKQTIDLLDKPVQPKLKVVK